MNPPAPFPEDDLLRRHHYAIVARAKGRPAIWRKGKRLYTQQAALIDIRKELARRLDGGLTRKRT